MGLVGTVSHVLIAGIVFVGVHILTSTPIRAALVKRIGEGGFRGAFSLLSLIIIIWLIQAYNVAPTEEVWPPQTWALHLPLTVMPIACIFLVFSLTNPSPSMTTDAQFDKADPAPGFLKVTRHPMFWAIALWGIAHLLSNGDLASIYFFGTFIVLALLGMPLQDKKKEEQLGSRWGPFAMRTSIVPFVAAIQGRNDLKWSDLSWWRILAGLVLYAALLFLHPVVFGVSVLPG